MALRINFNYESAVTHTSLLQTEREMNKSLLRLSTGLRILNASDDSAGLFVADQLAIVASGLQTGNLNIQTGISALTIAENSAGQVFNKLNEIYARAGRAANDINDPNARAALQQEIMNFVDAIQKIGTDTEYNGIKLLDGTFQNKYIHYGPRYGQVVNVSIGDLRAQSLGAYIVDGTGRVTSGTGSLTSLTGTLYTLDSGDYLRVGGKTVLYNNSTNVYLVDAATAVQNINNDASLQAMGIEAVAKNQSTAATFTGVFTETSATSPGTVNLNFYIGQATVGTPTFSVTGITANTSLNDLVSQINAAASAANAPVTASIDNGKLVLKTTNGETIAIEASYTGSGTATINFDQLLEGATSVTGVTNGGSAYAVKIGQLSIYSSNPFVVNENGVDIVGTNGTADANLNATFNNLYSINVSTNAGAERALLIVKKALQKADTIRAQIGAVMNNLQSIYDAQNVAYDNTKNAENVIRNTDYAQEMSNFTSLQIKMQSSIAMLAQANQLPQLVLQLLR
ncbi:flagellin [Thermocrinis minervae]|uniref:Flagellin n=1 Tax=Thermocrinis minervae TaxID=381751 RepID=A0A1M6QLJ3_9AQUI|nr:flagellin [Thermocrinis minervae]SHK21111.1 flagellin [Thermocrinis minervae]